MAVQLSSKKQILFLRGQPELVSEMKSRLKTFFDANCVRQESWPFPAWAKSVIIGKGGRGLGRVHELTGATVC